MLGVVKRVCSDLIPDTPFQGGFLATKSTTQSDHTYLIIFVAVNSLCAKFRWQKTRYEKKCQQRFSMKRELK